VAGKRKREEKKRKKRKPLTPSSHSSRLPLPHIQPASFRKYHCIPYRTTSPRFPHPFPAPPFPYSSNPSIVITHPSCPCPKVYMTDFAYPSVHNYYITFWIVSISKSLPSALSCEWCSHPSALRSAQHSLTRVFWPKGWLFTISFFSGTTFAVM